MFNRIVSIFKDGALYIKEQPQFLLTLLMVIIIPLAFLYTASQFKEAGRSNQERLEKDRIGIMHDVFASYLSAVSFDPGRVQSEIEIIASLNPDITKFRVARDTNEGVVPVSALETAVINIPEVDSTAYRSAQINKGESIIFEHSRNNTRYWQAFRLIESENGDDFYIFTETSLAGIDSLFDSRERQASIVLFGVMAVVMLLVLRHVFQVNYSYLYKEARKANETKDLFTNMIAHELRAPLTAMRGYASLIRDTDSLDETVKEQARRIEKSSHRLILIVNDLLDVARIQSGKLSVTKEEVNVSEVIVSVTDEQQSSAGKKNITLERIGTDDKVEIILDRKRLHQALTNLVSNAIKYTPKGTIEVALEDKRDRVEIRVKDTGMGIEAKDQKELFAPFFRVSSGDMSAITGTGLGMWITKQLIELMGGSIGVESIKGVGTHVVITLPKSK